MIFSSKTVLMYLSALFVCLSVVFISLHASARLMANPNSYIREDSYFRRPLSVQFGSRLLTLELANTDALRAQGLSGRLTLPPDRGLLFLFPTTEKHQFWMKDMKFPIDILWLNQGRVVDVVTLPPPKLWEFPAMHTPGKAADTVLEINAGLAAKEGITLGSQLEFEEL